MAPGDPISYLTLKDGTDVFSSDGERVGVVQNVLADDSTNIFDGLVIDTRLGPGGLRFVDAPEVDEMREDAVTLKVTAAEVDQLPKPERNPAVLEHHGVEDAESPLRTKLRSAWDRISGRG